MTIEATQPRSVAFRLLRRVEDDRAWLDRVAAADGSLKRLDRRDRALADSLAATTLKRQITLDHMIELLAGRPPGSIQSPVRTALRMGLAQVLFMDGIADHAAVSQTVALLDSRGERGFVNANLRRAVRERDELIAQLSDFSPEQASLAHGMPLWIVESWWDRFGAAGARRLLAAQNVQGETAFRLNRLDPRADQVIDALNEVGAEVNKAPWPDDAFTVTGPLDREDPLLSSAMVVQARGAQLACSMLAPPEGARVLELCAAPGGKTLALAEAVGAAGSVTAVERDPRRASLLERRISSVGAAGRVEVLTGDAAKVDAGTYDWVIVDPPCSALGILRSRPDRRHHASEESLPDLVRVQSRIIDRAVRSLNRGGILVWCTCTTTKMENEEVLSRLLEAGEVEPVASPFAQPQGTIGLKGIGGLLVEPDPGDGFIVARLRRA